MIKANRKVSISMINLVSEISHYLPNTLKQNFYILSLTSVVLFKLELENHLANFSFRLKSKERELYTTDFLVQII